MLSDKDVGRRCCLSLIWTDRCTLESQADLKWNEEKMIHAVIQTNPEALVLNITLIFLNCYHFITKSGNHWFAFFISEWGQTFLNHCCVWSFITRHQRTPTSNLDKKWSLRVKMLLLCCVLVSLCSYLLTAQQTATAPRGVPWLLQTGTALWPVAKNTTQYIYSNQTQH